VNTLLVITDDPVQMEATEALLLDQDLRMVRAVSIN